MRFRLQLPRIGASSSVDVGPRGGVPVLNHRDVVVENRWQLPPHTVAMIGRRAVWFGVSVLGLRWEEDIGGHLFIVVTGEDPAHCRIIEAGPLDARGRGALVPFHYEEDKLADDTSEDFKPEIIAPPDGMDAQYFGELLCRLHREYDGNQGYLAIELPFLRVGRDSNSYALGILLAAGVHPRAIPKGPAQSARHELSGYPGAEDPVHRANFGVYLGVPTALAPGVLEVAYHHADGSIAYVVVGGAPGWNAPLPDGSLCALDQFGCVTFSPADALRHKLPTRHTDPPRHIAQRIAFPARPEPAGAEITIVVGDQPVPLERDTTYRGTVRSRNEAVGLATLDADGVACVLPLTELGIEMRDPARVEALLSVGNDVTVGLHRDRHPRLVVHGQRWLGDRLRWRRFHLPRPAAALGTTVALIAVMGVVWLLIRRPRR